MIHNPGAVLQAVARNTQNEASQMRYSQRPELPARPRHREESRRMRSSARVFTFVLAALAPLSGSTGTTTPTAALPSYWQVSCTETHTPQTPGVYVELRRTGRPEDTLEQPSLALTFWERGFQDHGVDGRWNLAWAELERISVKKIGIANPAWLLTVASRNKSYGSRELGAVELVCWRLIERMVNCHAPAAHRGLATPQSSTLA